MYSHSQSYADMDGRLGLRGAARLLAHLIPEGGRQETEGRERREATATVLYIKAHPPHGCFLHG